MVASTAVLSDVKMVVQSAATEVALTVMQSAVQKADLKAAKTACETAGNWVSQLAVLLVALKAV